MSHYFTQLIRLIGPARDLLHVTHGDECHVNYVAVFNPSLAADAELDADLARQIVCFVTPNRPKHAHQPEHLNVVGLVRGIVSLAHTFASDNSQKVYTIKGNKTTTVVVELGAYSLACSVSIPVARSQPVVKQLVVLLRQSHDFFVLLNLPLEHLQQTFDPDTFNSTVASHWQDFLDAYNGEMYQISAALAWPNTLNYRGFLGMFGAKKLAVSLTHAAQDEIVGQVRQPVHGTVPCGVLLSYFNRQTPKKFGLLHAQTFAQDGATVGLLLPIYNWLEYHEYHDTLDVLAEHRNHFASAQKLHEQIALDPQPEESTLGLLNPVNLTAALTTNLVITPLSYTLNGVRTVGTSIADNPTAWLPSYLQYAHEVPEEPSDDEDDHGGFLLGLRDDLIHSRPVYLDTDVGPRQYLLVVYRKGDIVVTLVYDSLVLAVSESKFFPDLAREVMEPTCDAVASFLLGGSISLQSLPMQAEPDSDFFYVVIENGQVQSSLPYLPVPNDDTGVAPYENAIFHLHDQLIELFVCKNKDLLGHGTIDEYLHKFNSNKQNDWMFYYIGKRDKHTIIIKNKHHLKKKVVRQPGPLASMYEYASLGFLDNLGEDVKLWLAGEGEEE